MGNTPKLRFEGFTDDWEQRKLGDIFNQTTNFVNPKEDGIELWSLTVEDGLTKKTERYSREFLVKKEDKFKEVRPGDIVYNPMNMTLGAVGYNNMSHSVAVSGYYTTMVADKNYDSYYINTWLKSPQAIQLYQTYATGSLLEKQRVQFPTLSIIPSYFPSYDEQVKIGSVFEGLDNLITLHQRKYNTLIQAKKFYLQNMFPAKGEKVPKLRFNGFVDDWEQRKYSEVIDLLSGQDFEPANYNDEGDGIPYMTGASCIEDSKTIVTRWTPTPKCVANEGDVLLVCKGSGCGTLAVLAQEKAHIARQFMALKCKSGLDQTYNFYLANYVVSDIKKDARGLIAGKLPKNTADVYARVDENKLYYVLEDGETGDVDIW